MLTLYSKNNSIFTSLQNAFDEREVKLNAMIDTICKVHKYLFSVCYYAVIKTMSIYLTLPNTTYVKVLCLSI